MFALSEKKSAALLSIEHLLAAIVIIALSFSIGFGLLWTIAWLAINFTMGVTWCFGLDWKEEEFSWLSRQIVYASPFFGIALPAFLVIILTELVLQFGKSLSTDRKLT